MNFIHVCFNVVFSGFRIDEHVLELEDEDEEDWESNEIGDSLWILLGQKLHFSFHVRLYYYRRRL